MARSALAERRSKPRYPTAGLLVIVRRKGRFTRVEGTALDFNRHGIAVLLDQPLPKDCTVYITLKAADLVLENVPGVLHNCISHKAGYRCGIQFRTHSGGQLDADHIDKVLAILESRFAHLAARDKTG